MFAATDRSFCGPRNLSARVSGIERPSLYSQRDFFLLPQHWLLSRRLAQRRAGGNSAIDIGFVHQQGLWAAERGDQFGRVANLKSDHTLLGGMHDIVTAEAVVGRHF